MMLKIKRKVLTETVKLR
uniref:Uncharacterized protein n=1 Tax=Rhizophora mucronata TaxID=61149 RepID=A0A2P2N1M2_RHIMU